jgi:hypothetical protein
MAYVTVVAYPYVTQYGGLNIPDDVEDRQQYVADHWNEIEFGRPEFDYAGTDFDIEEDE